MGRDKALLPWGDGMALLDHALARLREVTPDVRILCGPEPRYADRGAPVVLDRDAEAGPLGGLLAGLGATDAPLVLLLAVDLPFVPSASLLRLVELAEGHDAVVPLGARGPEPLCAVYSRSCLHAVRAALARGDLRMTSFWSEVSVRQPTAADLGVSERIFTNVNSPEDYAAALRQGSGSRHLDG
jgi:molybdopterin-guanine dinucleotide biosynthesis protein A